MRFLIGKDRFLSVFALSLAICLLFVTLSFADWYLEQKSVTKSGENPENTAIQKIYMKDKMMKIEDSSSNQTIYIRVDKDVVWTSDNAKKQYYEQKLSQTMQLMKLFKQNQTIDLKPTGNKKKIGKYNCEEYTVTMSGGLMNMTSEMWVTKDINVMKDFKDLFSAYRQSTAEIYEKIAALGAYPVLQKITNNVMNTKVINTIELTKAEEKKLDAKIFDMSAGYVLKQMEVPAMLQQNIKEKIEEASKDKQKTGTADTGKKDTGKKEEPKAEQTKTGK
jgi:hypothetical protein